MPCDFAQEHDVLTTVSDVRWISATETPRLVFTEMLPGRLFCCSMEAKYRSQDSRCIRKLQTMSVTSRLLEPAGKASFILTPLHHATCSRLFH